MEIHAIIQENLVQIFKKKIMEVQENVEFLAGQPLKIIFKKSKNIEEYFTN